MEIGHALKIQQGFSQGLQPLQRQAADHAFLLRAQGAAAAAQQAQGDLGFSLDLTQGDASGLTLRLPPPKDFPVGDALGEVVEGDAAHGAKLLD